MLGCNGFINTAWENKNISMHHTFCFILYFYTQVPHTHIRFKAPRVQAIPLLWVRRMEYMKKQICKNAKSNKSILDILITLENYDKTGLRGCFLKRDNSHKSQDVLYYHAIIYSPSCFSKAVRPFFLWTQKENFF